MLDFSFLKIQLLFHLLQYVFQLYKAFFAGAYFGVVYEWILHGCNDTPEEIQKKFADGFVFAINEINNKNEKE